MNHWTLGLIVFGSQVAVILTAGLLFKKITSRLILPASSSGENYGIFKLYFSKTKNIFSKKEIYFSLILFVVLFLVIGFWQGQSAAILFLFGTIIAIVGEFIESIVFVKLDDFLSSRQNWDKKDQNTYSRKTSLILASLSSFSIAVIFALYFILNFNLFSLGWFAFGVLFVFVMVEFFRYFLNKKGVCLGFFGTYFLVSILPLFLAIIFIGTIGSLIFPLLLSSMSILTYVVATFVLFFTKHKNLTSFYFWRAILMLVFLAIIFYPASSMIFGAGYFRIYLSSLLGVSGVVILAFLSERFFAQDGKFLKKMFLFIAVVFLSALAAYKLEGFYGIALGLSAVAPLLYLSE